MSVNNRALLFNTATPNPTINPGELTPAGGGFNVTPAGSQPLNANHTAFAALVKADVGW